MGKPNPQNLIVPTSEQARINGAKGGKKRAENEAKRKELKELLKIALELQNEETGEQNNIAITTALIKKAIAGDVRAYEVIRDTIGEKPVDKQEIQATGFNITINNEEVDVERD